MPAGRKSFSLRGALLLIIQQRVVGPQTKYEQTAKPDCRLHLYISA